MFSLLQGSGLSRFNSIRILHSYFARNLKSNFIDFFEYKFFLSKYDNEGYSNGIDYNDEYLPILKKIIQPGDILVDIGAKIGFYSLAFCNFIQNTGHVYAFEPTPESFQLLSKNKYFNNIKNLTIEQKAVSNINDFRILELFDFSGLNRINDNSKTGITVETITLDEYFKNIKKISLLKIDVEGHELEVLLGSRKILNNFKPKILFEYNPKLFTKNNSRDILKLLHEMNYSFYDLENNPLIERQISYFEKYEDSKKLTNILAIN